MTPRWPRQRKQVVTTPDRSTPIRTCVGCRTRLPQARMVRCVLAPGGPAVSRTAPGRGAWLCSAACLDTAIRRRQFERAWRCPVAQDTLDALRIAFDGVITNMEELPAGGFEPAGTGPMKG